MDGQRQPDNGRPEGIIENIDSAVDFSMTEATRSSTTAKSTARPSYLVYFTTFLTKASVDG